MWSIERDYCSQSRSVRVLFRSRTLLFCHLKSLSPAHWLFGLTVPSVARHSSGTQPRCLSGCIAPQANWFSLWPPLQPSLLFFPRTSAFPRPTKIGVINQNTYSVFAFQRFILLCNISHFLFLVFFYAVLSSKLVSLISSFIVAPLVFFILFGYFAETRLKLADLLN